MKLQIGLFFGLSLLGMGNSFAADDPSLELDGVPTYCHRGEDNSPTQNPCRSYGRASYLYKSKESLKLKMDANAFGGEEKKLNRWLKNR